VAFERPSASSRTSDLRFRRRYGFVLSRQRLVRELGDLAHHLDSGGSGSDHREGQVGRSFGRVGGQAGHLEGAEDMAAQVTGVRQRLQAGREHRPVVMPEVGVRAPGRDHQAVVGQQQLPAVRGQGMHDPAVQVQVLHLCQHHMRVGLLPDHAAQRRSDQAIGQDPGRDLIQQRLEQVVVGPVNDRDFGIGPGQGARHPDPAEPATNHDHPVTPLMPTVTSLVVGFVAG